MTPVTGSEPLEKANASHTWAGLPYAVELELNLCRVGGGDRWAVAHARLHLTLLSCASRRDGTLHEGRPVLRVIIRVAG